MVATDIVQTFAALRSLLLDSGARFGRIELTSGQAILIHRPRSTVAVIEPGSRLPEGFDVLVVAGNAVALAESLAHLGTQRVQFLGLPTPAALARRIIAEAARAADAFGAAEVADRLLDIGASLNQERDPARILERILSQARSITHADAGSIYLAEDEGKKLRFMAAHNDSVDADFSEFTMDVTPSSIVGAAVLGRRTVRVADLYAEATTMTGSLFFHDRRLDEKLGYQTRSVITTPMITPEGRVLGVIQLINARVDSKGPLTTPSCFDSRVRAFTDDDEHLCAALGSQGATALGERTALRRDRSLVRGVCARERPRDRANATRPPAVTPSGSPTSPSRWPRSSTTPATATSAT